MKLLFICEDFGYIGSKISIILLYMYRNDEIHEEFKTLGDVVIKYVVFVHRGVSLGMNFTRLSHDGVTLDVDRDVSTAILLVFITALQYSQDFGIITKESLKRVRAGKYFTNENHTILSLTPARSLQMSPLCHLYLQKRSTSRLKVL